MRLVSCALVLAACGSRTALGVPNETMECGDDDALSATLQITSDDRYRVWVNGVLVDDGVRKWWEVQTRAVSIHRSKRNTLAIEGTNTWSQDGVDRGVIADLRFTTSSGEQHVVTSSGWRISTVPVYGWEKESFDASVWPHAVSEGKNGVAPYGPILGTSRAEWLWSYTSNGPMTAKPGEETVLLWTEFRAGNACP